MSTRCGKESKNPSTRASHNIVWDSKRSYEAKDHKSSYIHVGGQTEEAWILVNQGL